MRALFASLFLLFLSFSRAQSLVTFSSNNTFMACQPSVIQWSGGIPPYDVSILLFATQVDAPLAQATSLDGVMLIVIPSGGAHVLFINVTPSGSSIAQQQNITVIQPPDTQSKCLENSDGSVHLSNFTRLASQPSTSIAPDTCASVAETRQILFIVIGIAAGVGIQIISWLILRVLSCRRQKRREEVYVARAGAYASVDATLPQTLPHARWKGQAPSTVLDVPDTRGLRLGRLTWNPARSRQNSDTTVFLPLPISSLMGSGFRRELRPDNNGVTEMAVDPGDATSSPFGWRRSQMSEFRQAIERAYQWVRLEEGSGSPRRTFSWSTRISRSALSSLRAGVPSSMDPEVPPVPSLSEKLR